jgi:hypothetical protein
MALRAEWMTGNLRATSSHNYDFDLQKKKEKDLNFIILTVQSVGSHLVGKSDRKPGKFCEKQPNNFSLALHSLYCMRKDVI